MRKYLIPPFGKWTPTGLLATGLHEITLTLLPSVLAAAGFLTTTAELYVLTPRITAIVKRANASVAVTGIGPAGSFSGCEQQAAGTPSFANTPWGSGNISIQAAALASQFLGPPAPEP